MQGGEPAVRPAPRVGTAWIVHGMLVLATAWLLQDLALRRQHTLEDLGGWVSTRVGLEYGILGSVAFLTTRTALHGNRLDLGVWHGYQELWREEPLALQSLEARVRIRGPGYLVALFNGTPGGADGVRLATDPAFPAACLRIAPEGGFVSRGPLDAPLLDDGWHRLRLERAGDTFRVELDGQPVGTCGQALGAPARVGFRSGAADHEEVDDLVLVAVDGRTWREDFANRRHAGALFAAALAGVVAIHGTVLAVTRRARRAQGLSATPYLATTHLVLLLAAGSAWLVDRTLLSHRHPDEVDFRGYVTTFERKRDVVARLREEVGPKPAGVVRILVLGGSQTWGSGAASRQQTWVSRLEELLNRSGQGPPVEVIGGGIPAYTAEGLHPLLEQEWAGFDPDVVLVNLSHNDRDPEAFETWLGRIVDLAEQRGARVVLVPEANAVENRSDALDRLALRHAVMRRMAAARGLGLIETQDWLAERRDQGFLWWDRVHLTPYGQSLLAERLAAERDTLFDGAGAEPPPLRHPVSDGD